MTDERHEDHNHLSQLHEQCQKHLHYHVTLTLTDGRTCDGIIQQVDNDQINVLVGEDVMEREDAHDSNTRQYYGGLGHPRRRFRRYRSQLFPLAALTTLALLPYIYQPYPYYPSYPTYPYYPAY